MIFFPPRLGRCEASVGRFQFSNLATLVGQCLWTTNSPAGLPGLPNWITQRKSMWSRGEHASSTHKGPGQDSNPQPSCCKVTVLTTAPPVYIHKFSSCQSHTGALNGCNKRLIFTRSLENIYSEGNIIVSY